MTRRTETRETRCVAPSELPPATPVGIVSYGSGACAELLGGRIVFMGTISQNGAAGNARYAASKGGVAGEERS